MNSHRRYPLLSAVCASATLSIAAFAALPKQSDPIPSDPLNPIRPTPNAPGLPNDLPSRPAEGFKSGPTTMPSRATEKVVADVSIASSETLHISEIAAQRAVNEQVRTLASRVQSSAQAIEHELDQIALTKNVMIPTGRTSADMADDDEKWKSKDADDFDEDYVKRTVKLHRDAIDALEDYVDDRNADADMAAFAQKHLPMLRENLRQAQQLEDQLD